VTSRASRSSTPAVQIQGVVKSFDGVRAVDGIDLTVETAQVVALLGPNGAGKTTTVEMCEGFVTPDAGTVRVLGLDPIADSGEVRSRIGVMLQGGGAYPGSKAGEMLDLVAAYSADPLDPAWLLSKLGLTDARKTPYRRLSGGQQQRLSLACALVGRPELVFLDEPTAGLDPIGAAAFDRLIKTLQEALGLTVFLITHDLDTLYAICDRVAVIADRKVVANAPLPDIEKLDHPWIQEYFHGPRARAARGEQIESA